MGLTAKSRISLLAMLIALPWFDIYPADSPAQNRCLTKPEADRVIRLMDDPGKLNKNRKLKRELLKMERAQIDLNEKIILNSRNAGGVIEDYKNRARNNLIRLCGMIRQNGWPRKKTVGKDGLEAAFYLIRNSEGTDLQREIFPVLAAASQRGLIPKGNFAALIDKLRIDSHGKQIFGTQIKIKDEIGYLYPIENEVNVDKRRKLYELAPIAEFIKLIEIQYRTIIVKMQSRPEIGRKDLPAATISDSSITGIADEEDEILSIDSRLVNLNLRVLNQDLTGTRGLGLKKGDFIVYENGLEQDISFFSSADTPFDLVLLLDLSGSTTRMQGLIAESARRFIALSRPVDRIALVSFADRPKIISGFSGNKQMLFSKLRELDDYGGSRVWDALNFTYEKIIREPEAGRRTAVVFMTDGVDNTLVQRSRRQGAGSYLLGLMPSKITFTELLETTRRNDATLFAIFLDTEKMQSGVYSNAKSYRQARISLKMLSEESGGQYYRAGQIGDLSGIYQKIINDLSEVYSLGYEPSVSDGDRSWREISVKVKGRPDLIVKTKTGFYAR